MPEIEHFFAPVSGFAYLGHAALLRLAWETGARVCQRPIDIARVFEAGGSTPPVRQSEARRTWRALDMKRWAARRSLPLQAKPAHWPTDGDLAAHAIIAVEGLGGPVDCFVDAILSAVWARDLDIARPDTLAALLRECGVDADAALALARQDAIGALYEANTRAAIEAGAFGSPTYRVGSEIYFGQDRLDFVHSALLDGAGD